MSSSALQPTTVDVLGIHHRYSRLLVVRVRLSAKPSRRWRALFGTVVAEQGAARAEAPLVDDDGIVLTPMDDALEADLARLEQWIRLTNARLALENRTPRPVSEPGRPFSATVELQETVSADVLERIREARNRAAGMSSVFQSAVWTLETVDDKS